jgi:formylmethanofuran dehydrogenase subunit B
MRLMIGRKTPGIGCSMTRVDVLTEPAVAWIDGTSATLDQAAAEAARLLIASRQPLFAGLGTDVDGVRRAVALAERVGGVVEHMHSASILRDLDCLRETGVMLTTPGEARVRGDVLLLVGDDLDEAWPALNERLLTGRGRFEGADAQPRQIVVLAKDERSTRRLQPGRVETAVFGQGSEFAANLAALRARVKRRPREAASDLARLDTIAELLRQAKFGVAIWSASSLDALEIEMVNGLVRDLNESTRFSSLPLAAGDNGAGALAVCGWMTGFPMRTGFGSGAPIHDPWRFDSERLVRAGEVDCIVWISAFGAPPPESASGSISIALCDRPARPAHAPKVLIEVGRPGVDHDAVVHSLDTGSLIAVRANTSSSGDLPSVAEGLARIAGSLRDSGAEAC